MDPSLSKEATTRALLIFLILGILCYGNTLSANFVWDDGLLLVNDPNIKEIKNALNFLQPRYWQEVYGGSRGQYRPVRALSFVFSYQLWGLNPFWYHLTNLCLHLLNAFVVYMVVALIFKGRVDPLLAGILFLVHPVNTESVSWIKNRTELFGLFFFMLSWLMFHRSLSPREKNDAARLLPGGAVAYVLSLILFVLALASKENTIVLPLILVAYIFCFVPQEKRRAAFKKAAPLFLTAALCTAFLFLIIGVDIKKAGEYPPIDLISNIIAFPETLVFYFKMLLFPLKLSASHDMTPGFSLLQAKFLVPASILFFLAGLTVLSYRYSKVVFFSLIWIWITLLPVSNILFIYGRPLAEQRLYLPSLGYSILLSFFLCRLRSVSLGHVSSSMSRNATLVVTILILTLFSMQTRFRNAVWKDKIALFEDSASKDFNKGGIHYNLGEAYQSAGLIDKAIIAYKNSLLMWPTNSRAHVNLGMAYFARKKHDLAIEELKQAIELDPEDPNTPRFLAEVYLHKGETDLALEQLGQALSQDPGKPEIHIQMGLAYQEKNQYELALQSFKEALKLMPDQAAVWVNLGDVYLEMGRYDDAERAYKEALDKAPMLATAHSGMGNIHYKRGFYDLARTELKEALRLKPDLAVAHGVLGSVYFRMGLLDLSLYEYLKCLELDEEQASAHYNLGMVYRIQGKPDQAREQINRARELGYPVRPEVINSLRRD